MISSSDPSGGIRSRRSVVLDTIVGLLIQTTLVFSLYLLFAGHNAPGGGFVGGLVAGAALVMRYVQGDAEELAATVRVRFSTLLGSGLLIAVGTAVAPLVVGGSLLESGKLTIDLGILGKLKATSALIFDIGVYLVVVGLVLAVLSSMGAEADAHPLPEEGN